ncbi:MAG: alpha/beta fold hydrolase [Gaiellaceae bacterium]
MTIRVAESRGYAISYEDAGEGPAVVLVNGFASPAAEWRKFGYVDRLVDRYRVLPVDSLGHGQSASPHDWEAYRAPDVAADIVATMDAVGVGRAAVWGYSRGGWLAAMVAAEYPDRVAALIVGGWAASAPPSDSEDVRPRTEALLGGDWDAFWAALGFSVSDEDRRYMEESSDPRALGAVDLGRLRSRYAIDLGRIAAPVLLYCGAQEIATPQFAGELRSTADALGIEPHVLSGDHDHITAFTDADSVLAVVEAHLRAIGTW